MDLNELIDEDQRFYEAMANNADEFSEPFRMDVGRRLAFLREVRATMLDAARELHDMHMPSIAATLRRLAGERPNGET